MSTVPTNELMLIRGIQVAADTIVELAHETELPGEAIIRDLIGRQLGQTCLITFVDGHRIIARLGERQLPTPGCGPSGTAGSDCHQAH